MNFILRQLLLPHAASAILPPPSDTTESSNTGKNKVKGSFVQVRLASTYRADCVKPNLTCAKQDIGCLCPMKCSAPKDTSGGFYHNVVAIASDNGASSCVWAPNSTFHTHFEPRNTTHATCSVIPVLLRGPIICPVHVEGGQLYDTVPVLGIPTVMKRERVVQLDEISMMTQGSHKQNNKKTSGRYPQHKTANNHGPTASDVEAKAAHEKHEMPTFMRGCAVRANSQRSGRLHHEGPHGAVTCHKAGAYPRTDNLWRCSIGNLSGAGYFYSQSQFHTPPCEISKGEH